MLLLVVINGVIMAAIKESFFRGFLLRLWTQGKRPWVANIVVSILFCSYTGPSPVLR
ncbi:MAG: CPBP family intramembrane metalloprotease [Firmicutes bacterium]|nr:CPBP family intramembrane metalloprotease [Bacillota bacterium]